MMTMRTVSRMKRILAMIREIFWMILKMLRMNNPISMRSLDVMVFGRCCKKWKGREHGSSLPISHQSITFHIPVQPYDTPTNTFFYGLEKAHSRFIFRNWPFCLFWTEQPGFQTG